MENGAETIENGAETIENGTETIPNGAETIENGGKPQCTIWIIVRDVRVGLWKIKMLFICYFGILIGIGIGIGIEVGMTSGSVQNSGEVCVFCIVGIGGTSPPV